MKKTFRQEVESLIGWEIAKGTPPREIVLALTYYTQIVVAIEESRGKAPEVPVKVRRPTKKGRR